MSFGTFMVMKFLSKRIKQVCSKRNPLRFLDIYTCGIDKELNCSSSPDAVPVRDGHHEGRLSGRRAEQTPHADVQQRATGQEKHGHLISQSCRVHDLFQQYTSVMSLLKTIVMLSLWDSLMIKSTRVVSLKSNKKRCIKTPLLDLEN